MKGKKKRIEELTSPLKNVYKLSRIPTMEDITSNYKKKFSRYHNTDKKPKIENSEASGLQIKTRNDNFITRF